MDRCLYRFHRGPPVAIEEFRVASIPAKQPPRGGRRPCSSLLHATRKYRSLQAGPSFLEFSGFGSARAVYNQARANLHARSADDTEIFRVAAACSMVRPP